MQNKNPAKSVGLAKQTHDKITTKVNVKRAKQKAEDDAKAAMKAHEEQHHATNVARIAALEDKFAEYEDTDFDLFSEYSLLTYYVGGNCADTSISNQADHVIDLFGSSSSQEWEYNCKLSANHSPL